MFSDITDPDITKNNASADKSLEYEGYSAELMKPQYDSLSFKGCIVLTSNNR
jgi:hypothetical protein